MRAVSLSDTLALKIGAVGFGKLILLILLQQSILGFLFVFTCIWNRIFQLHLFFHYEANLCILSGSRNKPKSGLSRNSQLCYFSLIFFAVLDSTNKYLKHGTAQTCSKNRQFCGIQNSLWNPHSNNKTLLYLNWAIADSATVSGIRKL